MPSKNKLVTIPTYQMVDTSDPNVKRFCDREGNWTHYWLVEEKRFVKAVNHILKRGYPKGDGLYQWLKNTTADEAERRLKTAGEEGTRTHDAIRDLAAGNRVTMSTMYHNDMTGKKERLNNEEWDNLQGYINFSTKYECQLIDEEFVVASAFHGYAGTSDRLALIRIPLDDKCFPEAVRGQWVLTLIDWKTSSKLWPEYSLQISAYWAEVAVKEKYKPFVQAFFGKSFGLLVRVGTKHKSKFEIEVYTEKELAENFTVFQSCIVVANHQEPTFEPVIEEIPMEFYHPLKMATVPKVQLPTQEIVVSASESEPSTNRITEALDNFPSIVPRPDKKKGKAKGKARKPRKSKGK